jgi:hypothetical protein
MHCLWWFPPRIRSVLFWSTCLTSCRPGVVTMRPALLPLHHVVVVVATGIDVGFLLLPSSPQPMTLLMM